MGVYDFYFRWLKPKNFPGVIQESFVNVTSLSVDANSLIHNSTQLVYAYGNRYESLYGTKGEDKKAERRKLNQLKSDQELEEEVFVVIGIQILKLVAAVGPTQYFFLAIDGPAPQAKIAQQRSRRFKNSKRPDVVKKMEVESLPSLLDKTMIPTTTSAATSEEVSMRFDPNAISPGTDFMRRLDEYLNKFLVDKINNLANVVYYSSHIVPGEGEHKIMDYFRTGKIKGQGQHVIYGMDTDLIMLSMIIPIENVLLWREDLNIILNINVLKYNISKLMGDSPTSVSDFVLILFLFGNDFMPIQPSLDNFNENLDKVIYIYRELYLRFKLTYVKNIDGRLEIDWSSIKYLFKNLSDNEGYLLQGISELDFIQGSLRPKYLRRESFDHAGSGENFDYSKFRNFWYHHEMYPRGDPDLAIKYIGESIVNRQGKSEPSGAVIINERSFSNLEEAIKTLGTEALRVTLEKVDNMVRDYLTTLAWVFEYYFRGPLEVNLRWYYPWYSVPLFSDISNYLSNRDIEVLSSDIGNYLPPENNAFINVFHQLLSILPTKSKALLPKELQSFMTNPESPIIDYYPTDFIVDYELKNQEYKGVTILPFVDPKRIIDAVNQNARFHPTFIEYYLRISPKEYIRDARMNQIICDTRELREAIGSRRGRGRGRGRGGGRGRGRGEIQGGVPLQAGVPLHPGVPLQVSTPQRQLYTPQYTINQGPYDSASTINFVLPKI